MVTADVLYIAPLNVKLRHSFDTMKALSVYSLVAVLCSLLLMGGLARGQTTTTTTTTTTTSLSTTSSTSTSTSPLTCCNPACPACALGSAGAIGDGNGGCNVNRCPCVGCVCCYTMTIKTVFTSSCTSFETTLVWDLTTTTFTTFVGTMFTTSRSLTFTVIDTIFFTESLTSTSFADTTRVESDVRTSIITITSTIFFDTEIATISRTAYSTEPLTDSYALTVTEYETIPFSTEEALGEITIITQIQGDSSVLLTTTVPQTVFSTSTEEVTVLVTDVALRVSETVENADQSFLTLIRGGVTVMQSFATTLMASLSVTDTQSFFKSGSSFVTVTVPTLITEPNPISYSETIYVEVTITTQ